MLDIAHFRDDKWGDVRTVCESQRRRRARVQLVDQVVKLDRAWRELCPAVDKLNKSLGDITRQCKRGTRPSEADRARAKTLKAEAARLQQEMHGAEVALIDALRAVPNLVHQDAPHGEPGPEHRRPLSTHQAVGVIDESVLKSARTLSDHIVHRLVRGSAEAAPSVADDQPSPEHARPAADDSRAAGIRARVHGMRMRAGGGDARLTPGGAVHGCLWLAPHELPARCVFDGLHQGATNAPPNSSAMQLSSPQRGALAGCMELWVLSAGDPYSSWDCLEELRADAVAALVGLGISVGVRDLPADELAPEAARTYDLHALSSDQLTTRGPVLARCTNHADYLARAHGVRVQSEKLRDHCKRYVHTTVLSFAPTDTLLTMLHQNQSRLQV